MKTRAPLHHKSMVFWLLAGVFAGTVSLTASAPAAEGPPRLVAVYQFHSDVQEVPPQVAWNAFTAALVKSGVFTVAMQNPALAQYGFEGVVTEVKSGQAKPGFKDLLKGLIVSTDEQSGVRVDIKVVDVRTGNILDSIGVTSSELKSKLSLSDVGAIVQGFGFSFGSKNHQASNSGPRPRKDVIDEAFANCIIEAVNRLVSQAAHYQNVASVVPPRGNPQAPPPPSTAFQPNYGQPPYGSPGYGQPGPPAYNYPPAGYPPGQMPPSAGLPPGHASPQAPAYGYPPGGPPPMGSPPGPYPPMAGGPPPGYPANQPAPYGYPPAAPPPMGSAGMYPPQGSSEFGYPPTAWGGTPGSPNQPAVYNQPAAYGPPPAGYPPSQYPAPLDNSYPPAAFPAPSAPGVGPMPPGYPSNPQPYGYPPPGSQVNQYPPAYPPGPQEYAGQPPPGYGPPPNVAGAPGYPQPAYPPPQQPNAGGAFPPPAGVPQPGGGYPSQAPPPAPMPGGWR